MDREIWEGDHRATDATEIGHQEGDASPPTVLAIRSSVPNHNRPELQHLSPTPSTLPGQNSGPELSIRSAITSAPLQRPTSEEDTRRNRLLSVPPVSKSCKPQSYMCDCINLESTAEVSPKTVDPTLELASMRTASNPWRSKRILPKEHELDCWWFCCLCNGHHPSRYIECQCETGPHVRCDKCPLSVVYTNHPTTMVCYGCVRILYNNLEGMVSHADSCRRYLERTWDGSTKFGAGAGSRGARC